MNKLAMQAAIAWSALSIMLFLYTDFALPPNMKTIYISDYLMTFHVAGKLLVERKSADLYPPRGASSFIGAPFDINAHRILKEMPPASLAEFMYPPLCAVLFIPLSYLPPAASLAAWQLLTTLGLVLSAFLIVSGCRTAALADAKEPPFGLSKWAGFTFLPVLITVWIGQVGIVFGLLPLSLGFWLLMRGRALAAGAVFSLSILKPQFLLPALVVIFILALRRRLRPALGFTAGIALFALLNVLFFSPALLLQWLNCLKVSDIVYSNLKFGVASHLMVSLSRAVILLCPEPVQPAAKIIMTAISLAILAVCLLALLKFWRALARPPADSETLGIAAVLAVGACVTPLVVPYLFLYDLSIWVLPGLIAANVDWPEPQGAALRQTLLFLWLLTNFYTVTVMAHKEAASPLLFVVVCSLIILRLVWIMKMRASPDS